MVGGERGGGGVGGGGEGGGKVSREGISLCVQEELMFQNRGDTHHSNTLLPVQFE